MHIHPKKETNETQREKTETALPSLSTSSPINLNSNLILEIAKSVHVKILG